MSYASLADMVESSTLRRRLVACAASVGHRAPDSWVSARIWELATTEGWAEAWTLAKATVRDVGSSEAVITDSMILSVIQSTP